MKPKYWLILGLAAASTAQLVACTSDFTSCIETRTCPLGGGAGKADAGEAGAPANSDGGAATAAGEGGMSPVSDAGATSDGGAAGANDVAACNGADLDSDPRNCGTCEHDCTGLPNLVADPQGITCKDGACVVPDSACVTGKKHCSTKSDDTCETDVTTSNQCGSCGNKCDAAQICSSGSCADSCAAGSTKCSSGQSVGCYALATSIDHCGNCATTCPAPPSNGNAVCNTGSCKVQCSGGFHQCNASAECEADSDVNHCGPTCKQCETNDPNATPTCSGSSCSYPCKTGYQYCGLCVAKNDPANCGTCGNSCGNSKTCINGTCLLKEGYDCGTDGECQSGMCTLLFVDADKDGFGAAGTAKKVCAAATTPVGFATNSKDCCDLDANAKPGQLSYFAAANNCGNFEYDCVGGPEKERTSLLGATHCNTAAKTCSIDNPGWQGSVVPDCGKDGIYELNCGIGMVSGTTICGAGIDVNYPTQRCH